MNERPDITEETKTLDNGESFYSEALTGSGTIDPETGTYGPPKPDPTVLRGVDGDSTSGGRTVFTADGTKPSEKFGDADPDGGEVRTSTDTDPAKTNPGVTDGNGEPAAGVPGAKKSTSARK